MNCARPVNHMPLPLRWRVGVGLGLSVQAGQRPLLAGVQDWGCLAIETTDTACQDGVWHFHRDDCNYGGDNGGVPAAVAAVSLDCHCEAMLTGGVAIVAPIQKLRCVPLQGRGSQYGGGCEGAAGQGGFGATAVAADS